MNEQNLNFITESIQHQYPKKLKVHTKTTNIESNHIHAMVRNELNSFEFTQQGGCLDYFETCKYQWTMEIGKVKMTTFYPFKADHDLKVRLRKVCRRVACILSIYNGPSVSIYFVPWSQPRSMPDHQDELISQIHVNGAFTYPSNHRVIVYRLEEFPKVVLHEVFHNLIHHTEGWSTDNLRQLYQELQISKEGCFMYDMTGCKTDLEPNEAIIEVWAELYHISFLCYENPALQEGNCFEHLLQMEKEWSIRQSKRILDLKKTDGFWREETHALAYIMIRSAILMNLNRLFRLGPPPYKSEALTNMIIAAVKDKRFKAALKSNRVYTYKEQWALLLQHENVHATLRLTVTGDL